MNVDMTKWLSRGALAVLAALTPLLVTIAARAQPPAPAAAPPAEAVKRAEEVLAAARTALGGPTLDAVKTLVATGRTRRVRGDNLVPIEFELLLELPDKYVRVDEFPAEDTEPTSSGFSGDALIQIPPLPSGPPAMGRGLPPPMTAGSPGPAAPAGAKPAAPDAATQKPPQAEPSGRQPSPGGRPASPPGDAPRAPGAGAPPGGTAALPGPGREMMPSGGRGPAMDPRRARLATVKQDFARLALGLFARSPAYPLTFSYAAIAEAPQGRADVLDVKGEGGFALRYFVNSETHLPVMVTWTTPPTNVIVTVPGQPPPKTVAPGAVVVAGPPAPPANAPKEEMDKYTKEVLALRTKAQSTPVEHRLYFADYREVDGLRLPFRLRRAIGTETTEETTFDRFRMNTRIDPRKFQPVK